MSGNVLTLVSYSDFFKLLLFVVSIPAFLKSVFRPSVRTNRPLKPFLYVLVASTSTGRGGFMFLWFMSGSIQRLKWHWFWFKTSQKTGSRLKVSCDRLMEPKIELGNSGYKASAYPLNTLPAVSWQ